MALRWLRAINARLFSADGRDWGAPSTVIRTVGEATVFVAFSLGLSAWLEPQDPFGLAAQFPWLWLVPVLLALRYGTLDGLLGSMLLLLGWFAQPLLFGLAVPDAFPQQYFLGGLVLVLVCGQFADAWNARHARMLGANAYLDDRLKSLTRSHYLLRLSHERIERELLVRPVTLRDLLADLQAGAREAAATATRGNAPSPDRDEAAPWANRLLRLLAESCELEDAAIHRVDADRPDRLPLAAIGEARPLEVDDPLVLQACREGTLAHVRAGDASLHDSRYLVCAPLTASDGVPLGLLVVRGMRFVALNLENLQLMAVLLGYQADALRRHEVARPVLARRPDCPPEFALELVRLKRLREAARIDSALVALVFDRTPEADSLYEQTLRTRRSIDLTWEIDVPGRRVLVTLLALAGPPAVEGYVMRIERALRDQYGKDFASGRIEVHVAQMGDAPPEALLGEVLDRCRAGVLPSTRPAFA